MEVDEFTKMGFDTLDQKKFNGTYAGTATIGFQAKMISSSIQLFFFSFLDLSECP